MSDGGDDGGAGAAAALLGGAGAGAGAGGDQGGPGGGDAAAAAAAAAAAGGSGGEGGGGAAGGGDGAWLETFSAEADGEGASHRDWLASKGFKDPNAIVKSLRSSEREITALKGDGRLFVPGEAATPEERAAFHKAIGVPDKAEAYEIKAPVGEDGKPIPLNEPLIARMREAALKGGVPKGAFEAQVSDFIAAQLDEAQAETTRQDQLAASKLKDWGAGKDEKVAAVGSAMRALGLSAKDGAALRGALGADRALDMLAKLGEGMAEDVLGGGGGNRFGVSAAEARTELAKQNTEPGMMAKLAIKTSPEYLRRQRLIAIVAADDEKKAQTG